MVLKSILNARKPVMLHHAFHFAARDAEARRYFGQEGFVDKRGSDFVRSARNAIHFYMVENGKDYCEVKPHFVAVEASDLPYAEEAFKELKEAYPELDHVRIHKGTIILDTKPNTRHRRAHISLAAPPRHVY